MAQKREGIIPVTIYFPDDLHEAVRTKAFYERTSINKLVLEAVRKSLGKGAKPGTKRAAQKRR